MGLVDIQRERGTFVGSRRSLAKIEVISEFVLTQMVRTTPSQRENALGRILYQAILRAIRNRGPDAAANAMQQHMQAVLDRLALETP